jgi:hypothetical protein
MKVEVTVTEVIQIFNEIQKKPEALFEMIHLNLWKIVEKEYLTSITNAELSHLMGRMSYGRYGGSDNH